MRQQKDFSAASSASGFEWVSNENTKGELKNKDD